MSTMTDGGDDKRKTIARHDPERAGGIMPAVRELTDGMVTLVKHHLELARTEIRLEARSAGENGMLLAAGGAVALLGWTFLLLAGVLLAGWLGGWLTMFITAGGIALVHLIIGLVAVQRAFARLDQADLGMQATTSELERNSEWVKEISDNS